MIFCVFVCVCTFTYSSITDNPICTKLGMLRQGRDFRNIKTLKKLSQVRVPMRVVSVACKLSITEKLCQTKVVSFKE